MACARFKRQIYSTILAVSRHYGLSRDRETLLPSNV